MMLSLETWVSIGSMLAVAIALYSALNASTSRVRMEVAGLRSELKGDMADLRVDLKSDISRLDERVYALAAGLRPRLRQDEPVEHRGASPA